MHAAFAGDLPAPCAEFSVQGGAVHRLEEAESEGVVHLVKGLDDRGGGRAVEEVGSHAERCTAFGRPPSSLYCRPHRAVPGASVSTRYPAVATRGVLCGFIRAGVRHPPTRTAPGKPSLDTGMPRRRRLRPRPRRSHVHRSHARRTRDRHSPCRARPVGLKNLLLCDADLESW